VTEQADAEAQRAVVKKLAKKLEIEPLSPYLKLVLGKELKPEDLTAEQATKVANAMRAKAARLGIALEGPPKGGATEKQLKFIQSLVDRGKITPAMLAGYVKDCDRTASMPEQLSRKDASSLIDRLTGLAGGGRKFVDDGT
jgi:hypothetical protein